MRFIKLFSLILALLKYASAADVYYNRAVWFVGNYTAPPPADLHPTPQKKSAPSPSSIAATTPSTSAWEAHQSFKRVLPARARETYPIIDSYALPSNGSCTDNCGITYKLSKSDTLVGGTGGNQVQLEYSTRKGIFYYDISFVDCATDVGYRKGNAERCPGWDAGLEISGTKACKEMVCGAGEMCIHDGQGAYYIDQPVQKWGLGEPIGTCPDYKEGTEIGLVLCTDAPPFTKELEWAGQD